MGCKSKNDLLFLSFSIRVPKYKPKLITYRHFRNLDNAALLRDATALLWNHIQTLMTKFIYLIKL